MNTNRKQQMGFSLVELMVASLIGLILIYSVLQIYLAQTQLYKASNSQDLIQSNENAIANLLIPLIRSAGFVGCGSVANSISNLNAGGPNPIGNLNTTPTLLVGYNGSGASFSISQANAPNSSNANNWSPALDTSLVGNAERGSDVIVMLGPTPGSFPVGISTIDAGSSFLVIQGSTGLSLSAGQFAAVSDCGKAVVFQITNVTGNNVTHNAGGGISNNSSSSFAVSFQPGAQLVPLQQTALFVGQGQGGQSALMIATLDVNSWNIQPLIPGVEFMKIQYGVGLNGVINQYVSADAVTNWGNVYSVRVGLLIAGQQGSGSLTTQQYRVLDTQVTVPNDNRLRHVYELTVNLRNSTS